MQLLEICGAAADDGAKSRQQFPGGTQNFSLPTTNRSLSTFSTDSLIICCNLSRLVLKRIRCSYHYTYLWPNYIVLFWCAWM
jgi:hypothetical protein